MDAAGETSMVGQPPIRDIAIWFRMTVSILAIWKNLARTGGFT
jgi:hypothetical protein